MVLRYLLEHHTEPIDIVAIMTSGLYLAKRMHNCLKELQPELASRLVRFYPIRREEFHPTGDDLEELNRKKFEYAIKCKDIPSETAYELFRDTPLVRFIGNPEQDNIALLVDDKQFKGTTLRATLADMEFLHYSRNKVYIWDKPDPFSWYRTGGLYLPNWESLKNSSVNPKGTFVCEHIAEEDPTITF